jgi:50S ribosomal protein L16 3-hydroxylase
MDQALAFLGGLTAAEFLEKHWQRAPLLCRGAVPGIVAPLTPEELLGLSMEEEVEGRLVQSASGRWHLTSGPFEPRQLEQLGDRDWTVLVSDLDEHLPETRALLRHLDFLPAWRVDDLMASYAVQGGSVGPHYDSYDVFLLQVSGTRRWQICSAFDPEGLRTDTDLRILEQFNSEAEWELLPGDMLYLPPQVAHFGVALTPGMTFSLGCRAPSVQELMTHFAALAIDEVPYAARYKDPLLTPTADQGSLQPGAVERVTELLDGAFRFSAEQIARGFASLVTQPKALFADDGDEGLSEEEARELLARSAPLQRRKGSRWLSLEHPPHVYLYVNGREFDCQGNAVAAKQLTQLRSLDAATVEKWMRDDARSSLLLHLIKVGVLEES